VSTAVVIWKSRFSSVVSFLAIASIAASSLLLVSPVTAQNQTSVTIGEAIEKLIVTPETKTRYNRSRFRHWVDADKDGCNTRAEVLKRQTQKAVTVTGRCTVRSGQWVSLYDGVVSTLASEIQIDHVVALAEAWRSGADNWSDAQRQDFANDLTEGALIAVSSRSNGSKSDKDPANWLPEQGRCTYLVFWVSTKYRWQLAVDQAEKAALQRLAGECPPGQVAGGG
jgi:hypothetical protein